jgi:hypothetical protein
LNASVDEAVIEDPSSAERSHPRVIAVHSCDSLVQIKV